MDRADAHVRLASLDASARTCEIMWWAPDHRTLLGSERQVLGSFSVTFRPVDFSSGHGGEES